LGSGIAIKVAILNKDDEKGDRWILNPGTGGT